MARRHKHSLSNYNLFTGEMGTLMPMQCLEVLPGDTIQCTSKVILRVTPLQAPIYHQVDVRVHHWNVPIRIIADNNGKDWEDFITGGPDGTDTSTVPTIQTTGNANDLMDYFGLPTEAGIDVSQYPIRAFNFIFNEFYRDQDTVVERAQLDLTVPNIAWEKDYFTTCRPFSQRGPSITIPIGDLAPITGFGKGTAIYPNTNAANIIESDGSLNTYAGAANLGVIDPDTAMYVEENPTTPGVPNIFADLAQATGVDAIEFREFFALQRFAEARARYGARYTEYLRYIGSNYKGTLDRPEYLGGGTKSINFSEVMQTAPDAITGVQAQTHPAEFGVGDLYGHGISAMRSNKFRRTIDEHGYIISMLSVRPKAIYTNGIERHWLKQDREDYFQQELEAIGQMEVLDNEVFAVAGQPDAVFGFQDRYAEYKYARPHVCTEFRKLLDYWHMGRVFSTQPVLNQDFTDCVPTKRIYNEQTQHPLWIMAHNSVQARRVVGRNVAPRLM